MQEDSSLTIWAQSTGEGMGALEARCADRESWKAAICGNAETDGDRKYTAHTGSVTINGGKILADGGPRAFLEYGWGGPGICAGNVTINGGDIKAWGKGYGDTMVSGAGITATSAIINGGTVEAKGRAGIGGNWAENMEGNVTIHGGSVTAIGISYGAGIGAAYKGTMGGKITITGGTVTASDASGVGIGSGSSGTLTGDILISGGKVTATGGEVTATCPKNGVGIGAGYEGRIKGRITISGGTVNATGHNTTGAGIGVGYKGELSGTIAIDGGDVTAKGCAGIGTGFGGIINNTGKILITDGTVKATGSNGGPGIGAGGRKKSLTSEVSSASSRSAAAMSPPRAAIKRLVSAPATRDTSPQRQQWKRLARGGG